MVQQIDLRQVRFYLENAKAQLGNIYSKHGTNGKDAVQQGLEEAIKELNKIIPAPSAQPAAVSAG